VRDPTTTVNLGNLVAGIILLLIPMVFGLFLTVASMVLISDWLYKVRGWLVVLVVITVGLVGVSAIAVYYVGMTAGHPSFMDEHYPIVEEIPTTTIEGER
jgi:hypothetical protein